VINQIVNQIMTPLMHTLVDTFGFDTAVIIKDSLDLAGGLLIGILLKAWLGGFIDSHCTQSETPSEKGLLALRVYYPDDGSTDILVSYDNTADAIMAKIGVLLIILFPSIKGFQRRTIGGITTIIFLIVVILAAFLIMASSWVTPESYQNDYLKLHPSKKVSCLTSLDDPSIRYPLHFKLGSLTPSPGLSNEE